MNPIENCTHVFFHTSGSNHIKLHQNFASKTMQEEFEDPQGQAIQWLKEKGQTLIYKTLHRKQSFSPQPDLFTGNKNQIIYFLGIKNQ
jgi:hypothetical protein